MKGSARERLCLKIQRDSLSDISSLMMMPQKRFLGRHLARNRNTVRVSKKGETAFDYLTQHPLNEGEKKLSVLP